MKNNMKQIDDRQLQVLINDGYIPIASVYDLNNISLPETHVFARGTKWETEAKGGSDKKYLQVKDIDMTNYLINNIYEPLMNFNGKYNGANFTVKNIKISRDDKQYIGLFGYVFDAYIYNVNIETYGDINGFNYIGGIVGKAVDTTINNCSFKGGPISGEFNAGGIVGLTERSHIINCMTETNLIGKKNGENIGGIVGSFKRGNIRNCTSKSRVLSIQHGKGFLGGIVGYNNVGGLIGAGHSINIDECYSESPISGTNAGCIIGTARACNINTSICKCKLNDAVDKFKLIGSSNGGCKILDSYNIYK